MRVLMTVSNDVVHDSRVIKEARALRDAGHEVRIIGWDRSGTMAARETWDGLEIRRVLTRGALRLLGTDLLRNPSWWGRAYRLARTEPFDVVHCHDLDTLPIGVRLRNATDRPLVYDCHEIFGYMIEEDVPRFVTDYAFRMERRLAPSADRIIAVNAAVKEYIDRVSGKDSVLVQNVHELVPNGYVAPPAAPFTVLYIGTLHKSRFVLPSIDVVGAIPEARLVIGGSKALAPQVRSACARHPNTQFLGPVPFERVLPMTREAHAVLSMYDPFPRINQVGLPNKIFEAMAAGRPSIVTEGLFMARLVEKEGCGIAVPYTEEGLRGAITRLREDPSLAERLGRSGLAAHQREYNWDAERRRLLGLYDALQR